MVGIYMYIYIYFSFFFLLGSERMGWDGMV